MRKVEGQRWRRRLAMTTRDAPASAIRFCSVSCTPPRPDRTRQGSRRGWEAATTACCSVSCALAMYVCHEASASGTPNPARNMHHASHPP
eukprot:3246694-Rhodomonas_salina.4